MISQTRNGLLAILFAAASLAACPAAAVTPTNVVPSCAPLPDAPADKAAPGAATPAAGATAPKTANSGASSHPKSSAADADDDQAAAAASDDDDADDAKDFPPLKPGESFHLIGFSIGGSKHVDEDAVTAVLPQHVGDPITDSEVKADTDKIKLALTALHVHFAELTTALMQRQGPDHCVWVVWDIQHIDPFSRLPYQGYWKFGGQTFSGNKALTAEQLEKAVDLKPDERVRAGAMSDAITGMQQAYDKVFLGQTVKIVGKLKLTLKPARVAEFEWQITEPPAK